jgi:hypothetical protein
MYARGKEIMGFSIEKVDLGWPETTWGHLLQNAKDMLFRTTMHDAG